MLRPVHKWILLFALLLSLHLPSSASSQELATNDPHKVEAGFLRNFAHYVTWPPDAFVSDSSPWRICVLGKDPFGNILENTFVGHLEQGRSFEIIRTENLKELQACQIVFIGDTEAAKRRAALAALNPRPILTVSEAPDFLQEGGIIRFRVRDHIEMGINRDQARDASLRVHVAMLEVSYEVLDNGVERRRR